MIYLIKVWQSNERFLGHSLSIAHAQESKSMRVILIYYLIREYVRDHNKVENDMQSESELCSIIV